MGIPLAELMGRCDILRPNYNSTPCVSLTLQPNPAVYGRRKAKVLAETRGCSDRAAYPVSLILQRFLANRGLGYGWMVTREEGWCKAAASGRVAAPASAGRGARQAPPARVGATHRGGVRRLDSTLHSRQRETASARPGQARGGRLRLATGAHLMVLENTVTQ